MMYTVYIIYSPKIDKFYVGQTKDVERRVEQHRNKRNLGAADWGLKYTENFQTRAEAVIREKEIKRKKNRTYLIALIERPASQAGR